MTDWQPTESQQERKQRKALEEALDWLAGLSAICDAEQIDRDEARWHIEELEYVLRKKR